MKADVSFVDDLLKILTNFPDGNTERCEVFALRVLTILSKGIMGNLDVTPTFDNYSESYLRTVDKSLIQP
jgi:hypothetical protein